MNKETYQIVLTKEEDGGYSVTVPDIDGCFTQGDTWEEAVANAKDAIELMLSYYRDKGLPIPKATAQMANVRIEIPA